MNTYVNFECVPSGFLPLPRPDQRPALGTRVAFSENGRALTGRVIGYAQQDSIIVFLDNRFHSGDAYMPACVVRAVSLFANSDLLVRVLPPQ